jgi:hypothetical protein
MSGIILLAAVLGCLWLAITLTRWAMDLVKRRGAKVALGLTLFPLLMVAPIADELIGKQQFEALCRQYAVEKIDTEHAMNRRVLFESPRSEQYAKGTAVPIRITPYVYRDEETKKVLVSYHALHATGGWFIRFLTISETDSPLLFQRGCGPENEGQFKKKFNITVIN